MIEKFKQSYTFKLLTIMLAIALVVALIGVFTLQNTSEQVRTDQQTRVEIQTEIVADRIGGWLAEQREATRALSNHGTMNGGSEEAKRRLLRDEIERLPDSVADIHVVERRTEITSQGNNETILLSTTTQFEDQNLSVTNSNWPPSTGVNFDSVDETLISWTYSDEGRPTVAVASPTLSGDRIVIVEYRTDQQAEAFNEVIGSADTKVVGDATGLVLVDENTTNVLTQYRGNASETTVGSRVLASETGSDIGGSVITDDNVVGYADVGQGIGWIVVRETPKSNVFGIVSDIQGTIGGLVLITILGFLGVMGLVRRGPIRSIQRLEKQGNLLSEGDLSVEPEESDRVDEIGRLQTAFVDIHSYMQTVAQQAEAITDQKFDDSCLDEEIPGPIGESMDTMCDSLEHSLAESEQARTEAEQAREDAEELNALLQEEADRFAEVMQTAAEGDFSKRLETDSENEAMREIATAFNEMIDNIESTIQESQAFARDVARTSATADESVVDAKQASEEVSRSVQTIASGATDQREHLKEVNEEMNNHSATIEEVAATAETVAATAAETASAASKGEMTAREAMAETENVAETMATTVEKVDELDALMSEVDDIVELIADIAEQTNMLALNANIEAARAGTDGDGGGFNVVADEVKQLAGETQSSAEDVADLIEQMKAQTETTVKEIRTAEQRVAKAMESVEAAVEVFSEVTETTEETNDGVQEISQAMDDQAASTEEVVSMTDTVAEISERTANESESVSAAAEEQAASMTEVSDSVKAIAERAEQLETQLERFDISADTRASAEVMSDGGN